MISVLTSVSLRLERLLAGERQQMLGEIGAARRGLVDHPRDGGELRLALDGIGQDFDRSGDDRQDVVEVMRDAAGELADRFHLLGLPDALLGRDLVGEIADESVEHEAVAAPQRGNAQFDLDLLAVAPQRLDFDAAAENRAFAGAQEALAGPTCERRGARPGMISSQRVPADRFVARPAEDLLGLRVPVRDDAAARPSGRRHRARYR